MFVNVELPENLEQQKDIPSKIMISILVSWTQKTGIV